MSTPIGSKCSEFPLANPSLPIDLIGLQGGINVRTSLVNPVCEDENGLIEVTTVECAQVVASDIEVETINGAPPVNLAVVDARVTAAISTISPSSIGAATAQQGALAASAVQPARISNVDNTADANKPVSIAVAAAISSVSDRFETNNYTDTGTNGTVSKSTTNTTVSPTGNTSRVVFGKKVEVNYSSSYNITTGGYICATESVVNTAGSGSIDKIVGHMVQHNLTGGQVSAAVGVESVLSVVGPTTNVAGWAAFYCPNMENVSNIGRVNKLAAFQNDHTNAHILNRGRYLDGDEVEFAPPYHTGLVPGRYYTAPVKSMTANVVAANVVYVTYVHIPARTTISKLGFNVTVAAAGNARLGLYKINGAAITTLVAQTGEISTATTGTKGGVVNTAINAGTYALVAVFSATPTVSWHEISSHALIGASSPTGFSEAAYISGFPYNTLPNSVNILPTFSANTIEPHLWFQI